MIEYRKKYYEDNKEMVIENNRKYVKYKLDNDVLYKLKHNIRTTITNSFRNNVFSKTTRTHEILGCSFEEFKLYLESKFEVCMTWENRGMYNGELNYGWDIDHKIPLATAINEEDIIRLNHYTNLQPLCSYTNRHIKRDTI